MSVTLVKSLQASTEIAARQMPNFGDLVFPGRLVNSLHVQHRSRQASAHQEGTMNRSIKLLVAGLAATGLAAALAVSAAPATASSYGTAPVVVHHSPTPAPKVVNLRVGEHKSFDRVVIDLRGKMPGYDVRFVKSLVYDGSGEPVPLKGKRFVSVVLNPASAHDQAGNSLYQGPELQQYGFASLRGVAFTGDFEGYVSFGISLTHKAPFRVQELKDPNGPDRLVIDFKH
jgi:hypothetical protein